MPVDVHEVPLGDRKSSRLTQFFWNPFSLQRFSTRNLNIHTSSLKPKFCCQAGYVGLPAEKVYNCPARTTAQVHVRDPRAHQYQENKFLSTWGKSASTTTPKLINRNLWIKQWRNIPASKRVSLGTPIAIIRRTTKSTWLGVMAIATTRFRLGPSHTKSPWCGKTRSCVWLQYIIGEVNTICWFNFNPSQSQPCRLCIPGRKNPVLASAMLDCRGIPA